MTEEEEMIDKLARDFGEALKEAMIATETSFRIPFTGIQIGWNRMDLISHQSIPYRLIEIRVWWTRKDPA